MLETSEEMARRTTESDSTYVGWLRGWYKKRRKGLYGHSGGGAALGILVMPWLKQHSEKSVCHESHDDNKGDDDRRDKPVPHYIPSIIPARRDKSPRIFYEIGLSFEPCFGGS